MRDLIGTGRVINNPLQNFTQTRYSRFLKLPTSAPHTQYDKVAEKMKALDVMNLKTRYSHLLGGGF